MSDDQTFDVVEITWIDSVVLEHGEWMDIAEILESLQKPALLHKTVGYLICENDVAIAIGQSINAQYDAPSSRVSGAMVIPNSAILESVVLRAKVMSGGEGE